MLFTVVPGLMGLGVIQPGSALARRVHGWWRHAGYRLGPADAQCVRYVVQEQYSCKQAAMLQWRPAWLFGWWIVCVPPCMRPTLQEQGAGRLVRGWQPAVVGLQGLAHDGQQLGAVRLLQALL